MSFGSNLQYLRKMHYSMTQEDLAEKMKVSRQSIAKWESDTTYPEIDKLIQLSEFFSCTVDQLLKTDMNLSNEAYSMVTTKKIEGFRMARYAVISPEPEKDARQHMIDWAIENGLATEETAEDSIIGWDFPVVSQEQINVYHMHGYAAAYLLPKDFNGNCANVEIASQPEATYAVITIKNPFQAPFEMIPNAYKIVMSYMEVNGLKHPKDHQVLPCFEREYSKDGIQFMDVAIAIDPV